MEIRKAYIAPETQFVATLPMYGILGVSAELFDPSRGTEVDL